PPAPPPPPGRRPPPPRGAGGGIVVEGQVFVDPTGRRRGVMRAAGLALATSLLGLAAVIVATVAGHVP
ncbi:hypothetical protein, partial [Saccharothrix longispora]|uniref:hypothetical protein n=1 Tax=Saccharothrix longispora TaxID=33920 RepID=UPI0028FD4681